MLCIILLCELLCEYWIPSLHNTCKGEGLRWFHFLNSVGENSCWLVFERGCQSLGYGGCAVYQELVVGSVQYTTRRSQLSDRASTFDGALLQERSKKSKTGNVLFMRSSWFCY